MPAANCSSTCWTMTIAAGKSFGRPRRSVASAAGPPAEAPIATSRSWRCGRDARSAASARRAAALVADEPRDRGDLGQQRRRRRPRRSAAAEQRRVDRVERAVAHRLEDPAGVDAHAAGDDQDRARRAGHDAAGGFHAVHARHHQVHQDQVRRLLRAELHRFGAVQRDPDDVIGRIERRPRAAGARRPPRQIVDDADSHASGSPIRSTTACSSVSS